MECLIICDGGKKSDVTYGSYKIFADNGNEILHEQVVFGFGTSNQAEYLIMKLAIKRAIELGYDAVTILTDSKLVAYQVQDVWACNYPHLIVLRNEIRELLTKFSTAQIKRVPRNIMKHHLGH
jgi:ribonuclease HI